eukprot:8483353-Pyramimonas_sp.AAC.1
MEALLPRMRLLRQYRCWRELLTPQQQVFLSPQKERDLRCRDASFCLEQTAAIMQPSVIPVTAMVPRPRASKI